MPPTPEKAERQQRAKELAESSAGNAPQNLRLDVWVKAPTWEVGVAAVLQDFTPGEVILLMNDPILAQSQVEVRWNNCSFHGVILFCEPSGQGWEAHISFDDVDSIGLRRTPRFPVRIPSRVFTYGSDVPIEGTIVDISGEGLGIELERAVPLKANIAVQSEESTALAQVRHCRELSSGLFRAGVEIHHIMRRDRDLDPDTGWMNRLGARFGLKKEMKKGK